MAIAACNPPAPAANIAAPAEAVDQGGQTGLERVPLTIHSANGDHRFTVEIAASPQQQQMGLMFRRALTPDGGMIFPYVAEQQVAFWMKNTLIPLDLIFIRGDGRIARIAENAQPMSLDLIHSGEPVAAVLEIAGGRSVELGIKAGDTVDWR
ncbi:MAG: DUF192 domain-containing protein [Sphingomicrobium sp.]